MTQPQFSKATKKRSKARVAIDGPSGAGKTYTALIAAIALAQGGRVAVIDTERGSASLYSDRFDFDVLELTTFSPQNYINAIGTAEKAGYTVVVIDSLSHAWEGEGGALDMVDQAAKRSQSGNNYTAWKNVTPLQRKLVDAMLQSQCHIVATMRSKTEYVLETNERGKQVPRKVGLAPVQRQGMEYEFTVVGDMDIDHNLAVTKSRCDILADKVVLKPDKAFWQIFVDWLNSGADPGPSQQPPAAPTGTLPDNVRQIVDKHVPPAAAQQPQAATTPGPGMWQTWNALVTEATALGLQVSNMPQTVTPAQLAENGKTLRGRIDTAKAAKPKTNSQKVAEQAAGKRQPTREELFTRVKELGEDAKGMGIVGLAWIANPRWSDGEVIATGKDLLERINAHKAALAQKETAHASA